MSHSSSSAHIPSHLSNRSSFSMNCTTNFTQGCAEILQTVDLWAEAQVTDLLINMVVMSVETGLYSTSLFQCQEQRNNRRPSQALSVALFLISTYILWCVRAPVYKIGEDGILLTTDHRSRSLLVKVNLVMWSATSSMFAVSTAHYILQWWFIMATNTEDQTTVDTIRLSFYGGAPYTWPDNQVWTNLDFIINYIPIINVSSCR